MRPLGWAHGRDTRCTCLKVTPTCSAPPRTPPRTIAHHHGPAQAAPRQQEARQGGVPRARPETSQIDRGSETEVARWRPKLRSGTVGRSFVDPPAGSAPTPLTVKIGVQDPILDAQARNLDGPKKSLRNL